MIWRLSLQFSIPRNATRWKADKVHFCARDTCSKNLTRKSTRTEFKSNFHSWPWTSRDAFALFGRALLEIGGAGRYRYIQINMAVRYWYGCINISYWNFVILADCFILLLFYFSFFSSLFYARRVRVHSRAFVILSCNRKIFYNHPQRDSIVCNGTFIGLILLRYILLLNLITIFLLDRVNWNESSENFIS